MVEASDTPPYESIRVLVMEDEDYVRSIVCRLLRQIGFRLINEAANGADGFRELLRVRPALIVCDIHMEPVDGLTFLEKLRGLARREIAEVPFIFLTADTQRETVLTARELRVDGYVTKPVSLKALKEKIDAVLRR